LQLSKLLELPNSVAYRKFQRKYSLEISRKICKIRIRLEDTRIYSWATISFSGLCFG